MGKVDLFDDEIEQKNPEMIFTDRDNPRRTFWDAYDSLENDEFYVINYYGFGGIGKSWLCKYLHDILNSHRHPYTNQKISSKSIILNFEDLKNNCEKVNVLESLANKFESECNYKFPLFKYGLYVYYRTQGYSNDSPEIERIQDNVIAEAALDVLEMVPVVGNIGSLILKGVDSLNAAIKTQVIKNGDLIKKLDSLSSEDISTELIKIFAKELREYTQKEDDPVVIFLDTYEQLQNYIYQISSAKVSEDWLWSRTGLIRKIPNVLWVLAGQRQITWGKEDSSWNNEDNLKFEEIKEIAEAELLKKMLFDIGIKENDIIDKIIEKTNGVPVHLALCKDTYFNLKRDGKIPVITDFDMGYTQLAKRFVGGLSSELKDIIDILACLESWDMDDIVNLKMSADAYEYILRLSFINSDKDKYYMHHSVQEIVYKDCSEIIQNKCLNYFEERIRNASVTTGEKKDYIFKKMKLQLNNMDSAADTEERRIKVDAFIEENLIYIRKYLYDYNFFKRVNDLIRENVPDIYLSDGHRKILNVYAFYHCVANGEYSKARYYIEEEKIMSGHLKLDNDTRGYLYFSLSVYERRAKNYSGAKNHLLETYELWKDTSNLYAYLDLLAALGYTCIKLKQYSEVSYYSNLGLRKAESIKLDTKNVESFCDLIINKAKVERIYGNFDNALECLKRAEEVLKQFDNIENETVYYEWTVLYQQYSFLYRDVNRDDLRREYALKALEVDKRRCELSNNYRSLAISYRDLAKAATTCTEKDELFDKAIQISMDRYRNYPNTDTFNEMFSFICEAATVVSDHMRIVYLDKCRELLESDSGYKIIWKEENLYHKAVLEYYTHNKKYDCALEKLKQMKEMLEERKDKLSEQDYLSDKVYYYMEEGVIYEGLQDIYSAILNLERANSIQHRLIAKYQEHYDDILLLNMYWLLTNLCARKNLTSKAIYYAKKQLEIDKKYLDGFQSPQTMKLAVGSLKMLAEMYESIHEPEKALETYGKVIKYTKILYENNKTYEGLIDIINALLKTEKYKLANADYARIEQEYTSVLEECVKENYLKETTNRSGEAVDYLKCAIGRALYMQGRQLEKARDYIQALNCPYSFFSWHDKWFYLEKIESKLISKQIKRVYLTKEEGLLLLGSNIQG